MIGLLIFYVLLCTFVVLPLSKELKFFWSINKEHNTKEDFIGKMAYTVLLCLAAICILVIIGLGVVSAYLLGDQIGLYKIS